MKTIKDVMQNFPSSCTINNNLQELASLMSVSAAKLLPVVDKELQVVGIISHSDLELALKKTEKERSTLLAKDLMRTDLDIISAYDDEAVALKMMRNNKASYLPVVDDKNHLKGVVSFFTLARRIIQLKIDLQKDDEKLKVRGLGLSAV